MAAVIPPPLQTAAAAGAANPKHTFPLLVDEVLLPSGKVGILPDKYALLQTVFPKANDELGYFTLT